MTALSFINARMTGTDATVLRVDGARIASVGGAPDADDRIVDLQGDLLLPGLINAHDHLPLNSLPSPGFTRHYTHVHEWIVEVDALRASDWVFEASVAVPKEERLLIGGIKNLLSGVTTVAHHDPFHPSLSVAGFPVDVVAGYGWAHSLYIDGEQKVSESYRQTPPEWPWIIHAAEGVDSRAAEEFEQLDRLGCLGPNTLIVHGIALSPAQQMRLISARAGLIWCPSSNLRLFGKTADVGMLESAGRLAVGTDSRLSGARDLLEELRMAADIRNMGPCVLELLATVAAANLLRLPDRGALQPGMRADLLVLPATKPLSRASRADVRLVAVNGQARYGDEEYIRATGDGGEGWTTVCVDGCDKWLDSRVVERLAAAEAQEHGLELPNRAWRTA